MDKLGEDIPGVLVLVDLEQDFDTVEWHFIKKRPLISIPLV